MKKSSILIIFVGITTFFPIHAQTYTDAIDSIYSSISARQTLKLELFMREYYHLLILHITILWKITQTPVISHIF